MTNFIDRIDNPTYKDRLDAIDKLQGDNFADLIDASIDYLEFMEDDDRIQIFLCALFAMPLPYSGAADELISHLQSLGKEASTYCIADCGCSGGQPATTCGFVPNCPVCHRIQTESLMKEVADTEVQN